MRAATETRAKRAAKNGCDENAVEAFELPLEAAVGGVLVDHGLGGENVNFDAAVLLAACSGAVVGNGLVVGATFLGETGLGDAI